MALASNDINAVVDSIIHGSEEKYVAELTDTIISEFERGLMYSAEVDLYTLARSYPAKASAILIKYKDQINQEVLDEIQTVLNASVAEDLASLASVYGVVQAAEYATDHFKEINRQTAEGVRQIIERQNVALSQSLQDTWYEVSADAVTAINHGLKPRSQVLAEGVVKLMDAGISVIPYQRNGKRTVTNHVDVALRRHITTQVSQAGGRMSLEAMDLYGHDLVITDAHYGARPEHAEWQGIPCSRTGRKTIDGVTYPDFVMFTGYGSVTGLKGANCRHMMTAYYPGISRLPDREFKAHEAKFGKTSEEYYQATQRQRELERRIRKTKREIAGLEKAGVGLENPVYVQKRLVLGKQQKTIKQFCKENKLNRLYERERAYGVVTQPRALVGSKWTSKERGISRKKMSMDEATIDLKTINSKTYRDKFKEISGNPKTDKALYESAIAILTHRSGTYGEDLYLISTIDGEIKLAHTASKEFLGVTPISTLYKVLDENPPGSLIALHNHPSNIPPTGSDFSTSYAREYAGSLVALHNGEVYYYKHGHSFFNAREFDASVDRFKEKGIEEIEAFEKTMEEFEERFGIKWTKLQ